MKYIEHDAELGCPVIELTRRNLTALLAKLDGNPPGSACTILSPAGPPPVAVRAVEDVIHYGDRSAGPMHPDTENALPLKQYVPAVGDVVRIVYDTSDVCASDLNVGDRMIVTAVTPDEWVTADELGEGGVSGWNLQWRHIELMSRG